ncbi:MAG: hypothetical protein MI919_23690 [Holophagales bacterium]|nr:hypothetical protein [Holophagales bacterium]
MFFLWCALELWMMAGAGAQAPVRATAWPLGLEPQFELSAENPLTAAKVELGRKLFFDRRLSRDGSISCASCHQPDRAFTDGRARGRGIGGREGRRNVPTVSNRLFGSSQFWDGRAETLEEQVLGPLFSELEMGMDEDLLTLRLRLDPAYRESFEAAFSEPISSSTVGRALAAFQRTLLAGGSPFDQFEWLGDPTALSPAARRGLRLFRGKAGCSTCHVGTNLSDEKFHNLGVGWHDGPGEAGRMEVTGDPRDRGAYKTPTLRNVELTAPYMHDGSLETLGEVIDFYDRGGNPNPHLDPEVRALGLSEAEKNELESFLRALTGPIVSLEARVLAEAAR